MFVLTCHNYSQHCHLYLLADVVSDNSRVQPTGTDLGYGRYGEVIEVSYKGNTYAAKKIFWTTKQIRKFGEEHQLCHIRHANLVSYCGVCTIPHNCNQLVLMEKMNKNLRTLFETEEVSQLHKFQILNDVLKGLNHLHSQQPIIVHRDLHERNILLTSKGVAKIGDFGNTFLLTCETPSMLPALEYMPPEAQEDKFDDKLDVFSFGHLSIYVVNENVSYPLLRSTYSKDNVFSARSEVERRAKYIEQMKCQLIGGEAHPLFLMVINCLHNVARHRPTCKDILQSGIFTASKDYSSIIISIRYVYIGMAKFLKPSNSHKLSIYYAAGYTPNKYFNCYKRETP